MEENYKKVAGVKFLQSIALMTQNKAIKCIHLLHKIKLRFRDLGKKNKFLNLYRSCFYGDNSLRLTLALI